MVWTDCKWTSPDIWTDWSDYESDSLILGVLLVAAKISFLPWSLRNSTIKEIKDEEQPTIVDDKLDQFVNLAYAVWKGEQHLTGGWKEHSSSGF